MNRIHFSAGTAVVAAGAAIWAFVAHAAPEPAAITSIPPQTEAALATLCGTTVDDGKPDPAWLRHSYENDNCWAPEEPAVIDGTKTTRAKVEAGMLKAKLFMASADRYQKCLSEYLAARQNEATRTGKKLAMTFVTIETHRLVASEASKKRVADQIAMTIDDFNADGSGCPE